MEKELHDGKRTQLGEIKFSKLYGSPEPYVQNFLNFAKSCVLSCLLKLDNTKKFHRAVFEL